MTHAHRVLTNAEFLVIVNDEDYLSLTIRGHQAIDDVLNAAISEVLFEPHAIEIERLTFALKLDLAIALRIVRADSRSLFALLNRTRNRFAHRAEATFDEKDARALWGCLPTSQRAGLESRHAGLSPQDVLREGIAIAFVEIRSTFHAIRTAKIEQEVMHELVEETLGPRDGRRGHLDGITKEIAERVAKRKAERGW